MAAIIDYRGKTPPKSDSGVRLITAKVVKGGFIQDEPKEFIPEGLYHGWMRRGMPKLGDVLLTTEAPLGEVAAIRSTDRIALAQRLILLRADPERVDQDFLLYSLQAPYVQAQLRARASGTTVLGIKQSELRQVEIPAPDMRIQRAVAMRLRSIEDLIENNRRRIEILEEMARLIYREWFVHFRFPGYENVKLVNSERGKIPDNWVWGTFDDVVDVWRESISPEKIESGVPLVGLEHLPRRSTTLHQWGSANDVGSTKSLFGVGDILFGKIRPNFHKVVLAPISGYCSTDAVVFRPVSGSGGRALAVASSDEFVAQAVRTSNGTKMPRANTDVLLRYPVPIPSQEVGDKFEALVGPMNQLCINLSDQNRVLMQTRDLLLPRLISGELDVSDLNLDLESAG